MSGKTTVIGTKEKLPFLIEILIGAKGKEEKIPVQRLSVDRRNLQPCTYSFVELKPIHLRLHVEEEHKVEVVWNKVYNDTKEDDSINNYVLTKAIPRVTVYEHLVTEEYYPFRCGMYHFSVVYQDEVYYGAFRIIPKNLDNSQFDAILQLLNSMFVSIAYDNEHYDENQVKKREYDDYSLLKWLIENEQMILQAYQYLEKKEKVSTVSYYEIANYPRKKDRKALQKEESISFMKAKGWKHVNKRWKVDEKKARLQGIVKYKTKRLLVYLHHIMLTLLAEKQQLRDRVEQLKEEQRHTNVFLRELDKALAITGREKTKYKQLQHLKREEVTRMNEKSGHIDSILEPLQLIQKRLKTILLKSFWKHVEEEKTLLYPSILSYPYTVLFPFFELMDKVERQQQPFVMLHTAYKPTYLLYEYYCYVSLIFLFCDMGFRAHGKPLKEQWKDNIVGYDLKDGSTVILSNGTYVVHLIFNELIEINEQLALKKGATFFTGEETRKPDIRIDAYRDGKYVSSLVCEIKYSPMFNIYQPIANTKAMEQLYKYWTIKHIREENGEVQYIRQPIQEVICLYPGSSMHPVQLETGCGVFLQYYPTWKKAGSVGKKELVTMIKKWLSL
ncbi:hypothetical protein [Priestia taiwanensis]|uniref:DUF2357 domain-containing protein n=1 Tax=Priestia taiwanensis TaxID=1347902 RepID=A0A917ALC7_9BACI|nr:hypothetical protein [Priestia taiwanensis]MBM7362125.1 hypothetical protein [Priestia taiwanensis]GGE59664.1 hypothetical protein GCM10007140_07480 [Priestia taiwanensis]